MVGFSRQVRREKMSGKNLYSKMRELGYGTNFESVQRIILLYQRFQDQMIYLLGVFWVAKVNYNE